MIDLIFGNGASLILAYLPYAMLYFYAFRKDLRFSKKLTTVLLLISVVVRTGCSLYAKSISPEAVTIFNYIDVIAELFFAALCVKSTIGRVLFIAIMLKNTANAIVIVSKFAEYVCFPDYALLGYHWTYSIFMLTLEVLLLPVVYRIIKQYFTLEITRSIAKHWNYLWVVPLFFHLSWTYIFLISSDKSMLQLACIPVNSLYQTCSIVCQYLIYICLAALIKSLQDEGKLQLENSALQLQTVQYRHIQEKIAQDRRLRHDFRHHLISISELIKIKDYDQLETYIDQYITPTLETSPILYCPNTFLNLMVSYYAEKCAASGISYSVRLRVPEKLPLSDCEITILFGNLLENAYDACIEMPSGENREIIITGDVLNQALLFSIENTYKNTVLKDSRDQFVSSKHEGSGIGVSSSVNIVNAHMGTLFFNTEDYFTAHIYLPLVSAIGQEAPSSAAERRTPA